MERVRLTKAEKQVLQMISKGVHQCPAEYPLHTFNASVRTLKNKGFIQAAFQEGGGVVDTQMTDYGIQYMAQYPLLHNPVNWSLVVASISAIGTILALYCLHTLTFEDMKEIREISQSEFDYVYKSALARMEYNPEIAKTHQQRIETQHHYKSIKDALQAALDMKNNGRWGCQIWAKIYKDEEYYYTQDYYIVSDDTLTNVAAEYIGMAQLYID